MKKYIIPIILLIFSCSLLAGCIDNPFINSSEKDRFIGTWENNNCEPDLYVHSCKEHWIFKENNILEIETYEYDSQGNIGTNINKNVYTYDIKENNIIVIFEPDGIDSRSISYTFANNYQKLLIYYQHYSLVLDKID